MKPKTVIQAIASAIQGRENCDRSGNKEWHARHTERIETIARDILPSGSGIDNGSTIDLVRSDKMQVVLGLSFHHMDEHGFYDGWTEHEVFIRPDWDGIRLHISGKNRNDIKDYLHDVYYHALLEPMPHAEPEPTDVVSDMVDESAAIVRRENEGGAS